MEFIKDSEFLRGDCPMTKEEIRILSVAKLQLKENHNVLDIGAGTGSVSIQVAKFCPKGKVIGIEKDEAALEVIYKNIEKFETRNLEVVEGEAVDVYYKINGEFDSIFIGGSGGNIEKIIELYNQKLKSKGIMVLNFITLDNLYKSLKKLEELKFEINCSEIHVSRAKGKSYMMMANNPIYIIEARKI